MLELRPKNSVSCMVSLHFSSFALQCSLDLVSFWDDKMAEYSSWKGKAYGKHIERHLQVQARTKPRKLFNQITPARLQKLPLQKFPELKTTHVSTSTQRPQHVFSRSISCQYIRSGQYCTNHSIRHSRTRNLERRLPKSLLLAIFAISSCLDHDPDGPEIADRVTHANHASEKNQNYLVEAALRELGCDQHSSDFTFRTALEPSIASCQTLALLALQQHGAGQFSRAGILCSLAASMALELRLHLDNPDDNPVAKEISSRLWWNIFVLEKMISFEMGRPVLLRSEEVGTPYPSLFESDEYEPFTPPWNVWHSPSDSPRSHPTMKTHTISAFHTSIDLVKQMERISREVYSFAARSALTQDRALGGLDKNTPVGSTARLGAKVRPIKGSFQYAGRRITPSEYHQLRGKIDSCIWKIRTGSKNHGG